MRYPIMLDISAVEGTALLMNTTAVGITSIIAGSGRAASRCHGPESETAKHEGERVVLAVHVLHEALIGRPRHRQAQDER